MMKFEDILKEAGLYTGTGFAKGVAVRIPEHPMETIKLVTYLSKDDFLPQEEPLIIYPAFFNKTFKKVLNRNQLFND